MAMSPGYCFPTTAIRNCGKRHRKRHPEAVSLHCAKPGARGNASDSLENALCTCGRRFPQHFSDPLCRPWAMRDPTRDYSPLLLLFIFPGTCFLKRGMVSSPPYTLVYARLSTFPAVTVTTTKRGWLFLVFRRSRNFKVPLLSRPRH